MLQLILELGKSFDNLLALGLLLALCVRQGLVQIINGTSLDFLVFSCCVARTFHLYLTMMTGHRSRAEM